MVMFPIYDHPKEGRSSHHRPTPTAAGMVLMLSYFTFSGVLAWDQGVEVVTPTILTLFGSAFLIGLVGFLDEISEIPFNIRLVIQLILSAICIITVLNVPQNLGDFIYKAALIILLAGFTNAYNFADGLNGMLGGISFFTCLFALVVFPNQALFYIGFIPALFIFLFYNVRGKIFMGDVGSYFLGFLIPGLLLINPESLNTNILMMGHLLFPLLADISFCVANRLRKRLSVVKPHRDFIFLKLTGAGWRHLDIAGFYAALIVIQGITLHLFPNHTRNEMLILYIGDVVFYTTVFLVLNHFVIKKAAQERAAKKSKD